MNLRGRNLSLQAHLIQENDIRLLRSELQHRVCVIPAGELASQSFAEETGQTVMDFQPEHDLETLGSLIGGRPRWSMQRADAFQPPGGRYILRGTVCWPHDTPRSAVVVKAVDKDMRSEEPKRELVHTGPLRMRLSLP
jgi:hypothetical protein